MSFMDRGYLGPLIKILMQYKMRERWWNLNRQEAENTNSMLFFYLEGLMKRYRDDICFHRFQCLN